MRSANQNALLSLDELVTAPHDTEKEILQREIIKRWLKHTAENSRKSVERTLNHYRKYCSMKPVYLFPLQEAVVTGFIDSRSANGVLGRTVAVDLSNLFHIDGLLANSKGSPLANSRIIHEALKAAKKDDCEAEQVIPITYADIEAWYQQPHHDKSRLGFLRNNALFRLCYDGLLRISEAQSLNFSNLLAGENVFKIAKSKTDQAGDGAHQYMAKNTISAIGDYHDALCRKLKRELNPDDPVFWSLRRYDSPRDRITIPYCREIIKTEFSHIDGVSGHSFRIGACEDLGMNDFSLPVIMQAGRWKSPSMPAYYLRKITAKKSGMSRLAELQNR